MLNNPRIIILAAGEGKRWNNFLNVSKHFVGVDGEPILHRTIRLLRSLKIEDIHIVGHDTPDYKIDNTHLFVPTNDPKFQEANKYLNSQSLWNLNGRTIILLGDVYFTEAAIFRIVKDPDPNWRIYCRLHPSKYTGCKYAELFAQSFYPKDIDLHREKLLYLVKLKEEGIIQRASGWEHYHAMNGETNGSVLRVKPKIFANAINIDDWTEDFDFPEDYIQFIFKRANSHNFDIFR